MTLLCTLYYEMNLLIKYACFDKKILMIGSWHNPTLIYVNQKSDESSYPFPIFILKSSVNLKYNTLIIFYMGFIFSRDFEESRLQLCLISHSTIRPQYCSPPTWRQRNHGTQILNALIGPKLPNHAGRLRRCRNG